MVDITKCRGGNCPIKEKCYRFTAKAGFRQSYFFNPPFEIIGKFDNHVKCEYFWNENQTDILTQIKDNLK
jgi:hypothetical protein